MDVQKGTAENPSSGLGKHWHEHANWHGRQALEALVVMMRLLNIYSGNLEMVYLKIRDTLTRGSFFAQNDLVAFTGWPSGTAKHTGPGF